MVDVNKNKQIVEYVKAYLRLPEEKRTRAEQLKIFALLNTNNTGASKDKLNSADDIDKYFKDVMGLTVMHDISQEEFFENIGEWAADLAKYKEPAPKPPAAPKTVYSVADAANASTLSSTLLSTLAPMGATGEATSFLAENSFGASVLGGAAVGFAGSSWTGPGAALGALGGAVVGAGIYLFTDTDDDRYEKAVALFGKGSSKINEKNVVEVLSSGVPATLNRAIATLDSDDEKDIRARLANALLARANTLKTNGLLTADQYNAAKTHINNIKDNKSFAANVRDICDLLDDKGVAKQ